MTTPRVLLANISRESISQATHLSIVNVLLAGRLTHHIVAASGPYLDAGRNKAVAGGLSQPNWEWFLFVDSDIEFSVPTFDALFAPTIHPAYDPSRYPVIGGVYVNPFDDAPVRGETAGDFAGQLGPVVYEWAERDDLPGELNGIPTETFVRLSRDSLATLPPVNEEWNPPTDNGTPSPVCEVAAIGTGFLAIHRSIFDSMAAKYGEPMPWFWEPIHTNGVHYGEDFGFALRLKEMGYPVLAHRGCTPMHHKTIKLI